MEALVFQNFPVYGNCTPLNKCQQKTIPSFQLETEKCNHLENVLVRQITLNDLLNLFICFLYYLTNYVSFSVVEC